MATNSIPITRRSAAPLPFPRSHFDQPLTPGQVARTLRDLIQLGFVEAFKDEHNVTRYRPCLVAKRNFA
jgi:hypothetical protein